MFVFRFGKDNYRSRYRVSTFSAVIAPTPFELRYPTLVGTHDYCKRNVESGCGKFSTTRTGKLQYVHPTAMIAVRRMCCSVLFLGGGDVGSQRYNDHTTILGARGGYFGRRHNNDHTTT